VLERLVRDAAKAARKAFLQASSASFPPDLRPFFERKLLMQSSPLDKQLVTGEPELRDVDLVIRISGEKRLSDFLLWESAYAELHFTETMWPDFEAQDLAEALTSFHRRERRFGGLQPGSPELALSL
jgi:hypothetical protein